MSTAKLSTITRAHKIRLVPNRAQEEYFRRACGIRRLAYNWALAEWKRQYELHREDKEKNARPGWMKLDKQFNAMKHQQYPFVTEVSSKITNRAIHDVDAAWGNFFKGLKRGDRRFKPPRFESKGRRDRFYVHNQELAFEGKSVKIGKSKSIGAIRTREELRLAGKVKGGTISRVGNQWYLSVQVEIPHAKSEHPTGEPVGIDMGITHHVATSSGEFFDLPMGRMKEIETRIRRAQKKLSRRWSGRIKKGHADKALRGDDGQLLRKSNRFLKQAGRVAKLYQQLANIRADALHKLSRQLVDTYELIAIEDLKLANMTASAKGTQETPGRNVKAKSGLNRGMLNAAMRSFRLMLEYKADAVGGHVLTVDPAYTSQQCCECGHVDAANRLSQEKFVCQQCGHAENADINAARNILKKAQENGQ